MGRGRPRGNQAQRDIGRAVGKGLSGVNTNIGCGCMTFVGILVGIFFALWLLSGDLLMTGLLMPFVLIGMAILTLIFGN